MRPAGSVDETKTGTDQLMTLAAHRAVAESATLPFWAKFREDESTRFHQDKVPHESRRPILPLRTQFEPTSLEQTVMERPEGFRQPKVPPLEFCLTICSAVRTERAPMHLQAPTPGVPTFLQMASDF